MNQPKPRPNRLSRASAPGATRRVAIYTRKSTEEGLDQEFNSLDAQREAVAAYVHSQRGQGWIALPELYDDGGFTGANTERPAFQRLLKDIDDGKVDMIAVYKIDRLSRSLLDFTQLMQRFEQCGVEFVSVTQQFSTSTSVGRMTLNLLATFAQFERETISERTRDKIAATRRKGMWTGGRLVLGFDAIGKKLVMNEIEAPRVRAIFDLYREHNSLLQVVEELRRRGWSNKSWTNKKNVSVSGRAFDKFSLRRLLSNPLYVGRVTLGEEIHEGAHTGIVDLGIWDAVQAQLRKRARDGALESRNKWSVLLKGLVHCGACGSAMTHQYSSRDNRRYSYYVCAKQQKEGASACPGSRVAVGKLDGFVVERIRAIGRDPGLIAETVQAAKREQESQCPEIETELRRVDLERRRLSTERTNLVAAVGEGGAGAPTLLAHLDDVEQGLTAGDARAQALRGELVAIRTNMIDETDLAEALGDFDPVWDQLFQPERARVLRLLLEDVAYDGRTNDVQVTFRPGGVRELADEKRGVAA